MKYNIAICGTFNVENYGDVMFPEIFKRAMEKRGLDFDLFLISPGSTCEKTLAPGAKVYSIGELNEIHRKHPLDAIIIGGGALIHYNRIPVKLENNDFFSNYNIHDSWYTPIAFAAIHGIKVLFNLPQVPYSFPKSTAKITQNAFNLADYISVRDKKSAEYIKEIFADCVKNTPEVSVYPDSVCCMSELVSGEYLESIRSDIIDFDDDYAVLQFNPQKPESEDSDLLRAIKIFNKSGMRVVLLPLGYTHNDAAVLKEFNNKYGNLCFMSEKKLNIFEMASVLAGCKIYIGASFHGAITTIAYGNAAISYNYINPKTKNAEIFKMYNIGDFVADNADDVCKILDGYLNGELPFKPQINRVVSQVNEHFDKIFKQINKKDENKYSVDDFFAPLIELLPDNAYLENRVDYLTATAEVTDTHVKNLENILNDYKKFNIEKDEKIKELTDSNKKLKERYLEVLGNYETAFNSYNQISNSFFWRLTSPAREISQKFKNFLSRHIRLLKIAVYLKGFLRGGFKGASIQLENYKKSLVPPVKNLYYISDNDRKRQEKYKFSKNIKFSILVPLYNTPQNYLIDMIKSVQDQTYSNWELCLADGSTPDFDYVGDVCKKLADEDNRIKYKKLSENKGISENTNECIKMSTGDFIALFDHDDILHPAALFECMKQICDKDADYVYTDEVTFLENDITNLISFHYKPDYSMYNLLANNYICHFSVFSAKLIEKVGMFRSQYDGSQDHDIILRLTDAAKNVVHIPKILYFWRSHSNSVAMDINSKKYAITAGQNAVHDFLLSKGIDSKVTSSPAFPAIYKIDYDVNSDALVSIVIATKNRYKELSKCIKSIKDVSTYKNYEIIIVDNASTDADVKRYYDNLKNDLQVKILHYDRQFNYSSICNYAVSVCKGEYVLLLDDDTKIIASDWIEQLLMYAQKQDVGAVGAKMFYADDTIQHAGYILNLGKDGIAGHSHRNICSDNFGYMGKLFYAQSISAVSNACLMVKKSKFIDVDGFDEKLSVSYNDVDFCLKLKEKGYENIFNPFCAIYHYQVVNREESTAFKNRKIILNENKYFKRKWHSKLKAGDPYYNPNFSLDISYLMK